jgi:predicted adenine nucleotide alpha hydrolase (AANH) superfamily ATPase
VPYIKWEYDVENFLKEIKGLEHTPEKWEKCTKCYDLRLKRAAEEARKLWIKYWTTTLNISPHKDLEKLFKIWDKYDLQKKLEFLKIAFRKNKGFERSVEYCKKYNIYRQNYCGCIYSDTFPEKKDLWITIED